MLLLIRNTQRFRLISLMLLTLLVFGGIIARLYYLQIVKHDHYLEYAARQQNKRVVLTPRRGDILDRNGATLATSHDNDTIVLDTRIKLREPETAEQKAARRKQKRHGEAAPVRERRVIPPPDGLIKEIADTLGKPHKAVEGWFGNAARHIAARNVSTTQSQQIQLIEDRYELPEGMVIYEKTSKREYPKDFLACHVLGYTSYDDSGDNIGLAGVELQYNEYLKGAYRELNIPVASGARRTGLAPIPDEAIEATYGQTLVLTIDQQIQTYAELALRRQAGHYLARGGVALVMDVRTGEILALANWPDFDPNDFARARKEDLGNAALTNPIQIGSVMKIFTTALLLDNNLLGLDEMIDCHGGYAVIDGVGRKDSHALGVVPFTKCFAESSNVAFCSLASRLEPSLYYQGLCRLGFGARTGIDLKGEDRGILRPPENWSRPSRSTLAIGYETAQTPLQVISAVAAIGNGGMRMRPHLLREIRTAKGQLVKTIEPVAIDRVASSETSARVLELMAKVVEEGTGKKYGKIPGYPTGGKTGTTRKGIDKDGRYVASFAGLIPIDNPRLAIYVYVDEPQGAMYGGDVAVPIFSEIAEQAMHILGIPPSDPAAWMAAQAARKNATVAAALVTSDSQARVGIEPAPEMAGVVPNFDQALEDVSEQSGETIAMPDFRGMTMVEAAGMLAKYELKAKMLGAGIVASQQPAAGRRISPRQTATLVFAYPSQTGDKQVSEKR